MSHHLKIVLVEPEIPQNTGNIARTCVALGAELHIVKPIMFDISDRAAKRAGLDYWKDLKLIIHESLGGFLAENPPDNMYFCSTKAKRLYTEVEYPEDVFLVFGKETKGLPEPLIFGNPDRAVKIPMLPGIRSLNLSNSVAVVAYEAVRQNGL